MHKILNFFFLISIINFSNSKDEIIFGKYECYNLKKAEIIKLGVYDQFLNIYYDTNYTSFPFIGKAAILTEKDITEGIEKYEIGKIKVFKVENIDNEIKGYIVFDKFNKYYDGKGGVFYMPTKDLEGGMCD